MSWLQDHLWVVGAIVAVALAGLAWWQVRRPRATPVPGVAARRRVDLTFAAAVLVTLAVGCAAVLWLLGQADQIPTDKDRAAAQADAIKTGATIALGTGGAAFLLLAYRRQRQEEIDTRERRITELYTKAVEQLGHEKAPVRLGALYSLERLAQDNLEHRQTVVDVFCAYLRMPYTLPTRNRPDAKEEEAAAAASSADDRAPHQVPGQNPAQEELQVRRAAQRILAAHLRLSPGSLSAAAQRRRPSSQRAFWPGIGLDLTGATLIDLDFAHVSVVQPQFGGATFQDGARFDGATFTGDAQFDGATFTSYARFDEVTFTGGAFFDSATFTGGAFFGGATFTGNAWFDRATFQAPAVFGGGTFESEVKSVAWVGEGATFQGGAAFQEATFQGPAMFRAIFQRTAFNGAIFQDQAWFNYATFAGDHGASGLIGAQVLHLDNQNLNKCQVWPDGYAVRPNPADPTRGTLVRAEQAEKPEPTVSPPGPPADNGSGTG